MVNITIRTASILRTHSDLFNQFHQKKLNLSKDGLQKLAMNGYKKLKTRNWHKNG